VGRAQSGVARDRLAVRPLAGTKPAQRPSQRTIRDGRGCTHSIEHPEAVMLRWALIFLVVALISAALGFTGLAGAAAGMAQILFWVFLVMFLIALILGRRPGSVV
jgi:uncharacterized membrane protein YtjA (UPF0391 family)